MSIRFWLDLLRPTPRAQADPVVPLPDPDETPRPADVETVRRLHEGLQAWDPDGPPVDVADRGPALAPEDREAITERLDVAPEVRPWDVRAVDRPAVPLRLEPLSADRERSCIDQPGRRCDSGDALTSLITAHKALEVRIADLEKRVAGLLAEADQQDGATP